MHIKILSKGKLFIISIIGIIFPLIAILCVTFGIFDLNPFVKQVGSTVEDNSAETIQDIIVPEKIKSELPIRLKIPKIGVDATIEYVGITSQGAMDLPKGRANVAWFDLGPRPGDNGNAVIAGHYGIWKDGTSTVFNDLHKLEKGDQIYIEDDKGVTVSFIVRESKKFNPNADTSDIFNSNDEKSHLNLITCQGVWNKTKKSYPDRLVIFADKEEK
ncbi:MAG: class F sortase [Candidatus Gracilibacteria bacterium]|nr:class F sortase [Candidatus Gracilibacteria bacterium]MDD3120092.1 class F sortase [Candidatus Gracilibacteria bacterium]MDD4530214.1 class F sortase [Candidatus Gracilibacteria bacterium]